MYLLKDWFHVVIIEFPISNLPIERSFGYWTFEYPMSNLPIERSFGYWTFECPISNLPIERSFGYWTFEYPLTHSLARSLARSLTHSLTHSLTNCAYSSAPYRPHGSLQESRRGHHVRQQGQRRVGAAGPEAPADRGQAESASLPGCALVRGRAVPPARRWGEGIARTDRVASLLVRTFVSFVYSYILSFVRCSIYLLIHSSIPWFIDSLIYSLIGSVIQSLS